jgi:3-dehydroquinate synthase
METITINADSGPSRILIGERLTNLQRYVPVEKPVIITDVNVGQLYPLDSMAAEVITIGTGEEIKTLDTVRDIYEHLVSCGVDRSAFIVGIGGGIVCDITGFVASTFLRGVRFGFVATTLLAQVDASVGGKNGVNFKGYKNMVGLFHQPEFVICDPELLKTLPRPSQMSIYSHILRSMLQIFWRWTVRRLKNWCGCRCASNHRLSAETKPKKASAAC